MREPSLYERCCLGIKEMKPKYELVQIRGYRKGKREVKIFKLINIENKYVHTYRVIAYLTQSNKI